MSADAGEPFALFRAMHLHHSDAGADAYCPQTTQLLALADRLNVATRAGRRLGSNRGTRSIAARGCSATGSR